jgi:hypothetical protein
VNPGPGYYKLPSDFGHYESKHAKKIDKVIRRKISTAAKGARKKKL